MPYQQTAAHVSNIKFDHRKRDVKYYLQHIHQKPIRRFAFSVISVHEALNPDDIFEVPSIRTISVQTNFTAPKF